VTNVEYLVVMCKKAMAKATEQVIKETLHKEMEQNKVRKFATYFITMT